LTTSPILSFPDPDDNLIINTDASNHGAGAVRNQKHGGQERLLEFYSRTFSAAEQNTATLEGNCTQQ